MYGCIHFDIQTITTNKTFPCNVNEIYTNTECVNAIVTSTGIPFAGANITLVDTVSTYMYTEITYNITQPASTKNCL